MKNRSQARPSLFAQWTPSLSGQLAAILLIVAITIMTYDALADDAAWEFRVVILQGVTAGGTLEKDAEGIYVDAKKTQALNTLATDGWEVVAVTGGVATDHTVYLRRRASR